MDKSKSIDDTIIQAYYLSHNMVKFLLVENLALKSLLHKKGIISVEEFNSEKAEATALHDKSVQEQIEIWKKNNSQVVDMIKTYQKSDFNLDHDSH